ncbi:MAG TPA: hypothetical protein VLA24_17830 [Pseudomonadales bacterium]|nr:hypothetical protein [Pseudomonadales bacterium]
MPEHKTWTTIFPGLEGYYWADDGREITLVYAEIQGGQWVAWNPRERKNQPVTYYDFWTPYPLRPPEPDDG